MRARLALATSQQLCRLREVVLRDKPESLLEYSPKGTVPVLVLADGTVIDESLEIMYWALNQSDPNAWLTPETETLAEVTALIAWNDGEFKTHLDRYKYASRYEGADPLEHRSKCEPFLKELEQRLSKNSYLFGRRPCLADVGIAPFVRQFANVEKEWFAATPYPHLHEWLNQFVESEQFKRIMKKFKQWHAGDKVTLFPG
jgi:glutathione S-transferase